jgi:hypothetical protein
MTTLSILGGDFEILFDDETAGGTAVAGLRMIRRAAGATDTIYTTRALYSAVADAADEFQAMGFRNPMLPTTPNAFTMENYYFIPRSSTEYLKEGAITADWALAAPNSDGNGNGVIRKEYTVGLGSNFVSGDIGRRITESASGDQGTLLDFEIEPDGTLVAWIRPEDSTPVTGDIFDSTTGTLSVTGDTGTGTVDVAIAGNAGTTQYSAIQAIGSVPTATEVYVVQDRNKLADSATNTFQWWETDTDVSLGIISILVRVINAGTTIADGDVEVFARRYTSLYDNFRLNVIGGGFSALPLASAPDINNTTGYNNSGTLSGVTGSPTVGNGVYVGASWATATAKGVITAVNGSTDFDFYLIGDLTAIGSTTAVTGYDFSTASNDGFSATTGTIDTTNAGGPTDAGAGEGGTVTITLGETLQDHDGDTVNEPYSITVNAQSNVPIAKVYERLKYVTRRGAGTTDLFNVAGIPGETYRGLDATLEYDANTGTLVDGEVLQITLPSPKANFSAYLIAQCGTFSTTHVTLTDIQTSLTSAQPADNDVLEDSGGTDDVTLHAGGTLGLEFFTSPKSSPFGTFTGSQIFGARGVYFSNPASTDTQAYILTDNTGALRTPPNTVSFLVSNTRAGDRILVARDTGTAGVIDKDQFGGMTAVAASSKTITVAGTVDTEVPTAGWVRVVENTKQEEHRYAYASRTTGASGVFTLVDITASTANDTGTTTTPTNLNDSTATFQTEGVQVGMLVQDTTNGDTYEVVEVVSETQLTIQQVFGTGGTLASGDTYTINETIQLYAVSDDIYDLIIDAEEDIGTDGSPGSYSNTFVQSTTFNVVVNVRQGKVILPFTQNAAVGASGGSSTVVRQPDTIAQ